MHRDPISIQQIKASVATYTADFRRSDLQEFEWGKTLALFHEEFQDGAELTWNDPWPLKDRKGVYFIFGRTMNLLYIGKASTGSSLGKRLSHWFHGEARIAHPSWSEKPYFVRTLAMPDGEPFTAPALEEYLIEKLSPPDNFTGTRQRDNP